MHGAVVVNTPAELTLSRFPAQASSMLVIRLAGWVGVASASQGLLPLPPAALIAPSTRFTSFVHQGAVHAVGLVLRAATLPTLLAGSAAGWADRFVSLDELPHPRLHHMCAAVHEATDDHARVHLLCDALRALVNHSRHQQHRERLQHLSHTILQDLPHAARHLGLSQRQLQRQCMAGFGLTPKQLQTLSRLQATLLSTSASATPAASSGADLAAAQGYYDQSHLGRDMRRLVGTHLTDTHLRATHGTSPYWPVTLGSQLL